MLPVPQQIIFKFGILTNLRKLSEPIFPTSILTRVLDRFSMISSTSEMDVNAIPNSVNFLHLIKRNTELPRALAVDF